MSAKIRAIIFDADGTLVDSEAPAMDVLHGMAGDLGVQMTREEAHRKFRGVRMADIAAFIGSHLEDKPENFEAEFTREYRATINAYFIDNLNAMPGAYDLLSRLCIPFGVASNGPREKIQLTLNLTGLLPFVGDRIFSAYDDGRFKPDPTLFLRAARELGVPPEQCAIVEDSIPGLLAGLAAGMHCFSLHGREGMPEELVQKVHFIDSLVDLIAYFDLPQRTSDAAKTDG